MTRSLPIGVFDSGVGGLTVLKALKEALPNESFIYFGDTARLPYGTKSPETVSNYALQSGQILINEGVKALVIACNTASSLALDALRKAYPHIPVIGVIEPSALAACAETQNNCIAILATEGTIKAGKYAEYIKEQKPEAQLIQKACDLFIALAEEGFVDHEIAIQIAAYYLDPLFEKDEPDCIVLGCTHFPILLPAIQRVLDPSIKIIDSPSASAKAVKIMLESMQLENTEGQTHCRFLVSDSPERFARVAAYFLGEALREDQIEWVALKEIQKAT